MAQGRVTEKSARHMADRLAIATVCSLLAGAVLAQGTAAQAVSQMAPGDVASAASDAVKALRSAAKDKLLVKDLLGAQVTGPGGSTIGTVVDFVVIPGGRIVAAIISTKDKKAGHIPVPFAVAKISHKAGKFRLTLPISLPELQSRKEVQALAQTVPGLK